MAENEKNSKVKEKLAELASPDGVQKYLFGWKKNGQPRAVYDIVKDFTKKKKKKKHKDKKGSKKADNSFMFYLNTKKKKKNKDKGKKHWHI